MPGSVAGGFTMVTGAEKKFFIRYDTRPAAATSPIAFQSIVKLPADRDVYIVVRGADTTATIRPFQKSLMLIVNCLEVVTVVSAIILLFRVPISFPKIIDINHP